MAIPGDAAKEGVSTWYQVKDNSQYVQDVDGVHRKAQNWYLSSEPIAAGQASDSQVQALHLADRLGDCKRSVRSFTNQDIDAAEEQSGIVHVLGFMLGHCEGSHVIGFLLILPVVCGFSKLLRFGRGSRGV